MPRKTNDPSHIVPRGIEAIVAMAAASPDFRESFERDRDRALEEAGIELTTEERRVLDTMSNQEIFAMAKRLDATKRVSARGIAAAAVTVAAVGGIALLAIPNVLGTRPDDVRDRRETEATQGDLSGDIPTDEATPTPTPTPVQEHSAPQATPTRTQESHADTFENTQIKMAGLSADSIETKTLDDGAENETE